MDRTRSSTPLSSSSTAASASPSPPTKSVPLPLNDKAAKKPPVPASAVIEFLASRSQLSSTVFVYDLAEQAGFGALTKSWAGTTPDAASVVSLQTRDGAGLSLAGRLSQGTSKDAAKGAILTAYTTPTGLASMAQSLSYLPPAQAYSRLVLQVPTVTPVGESFELSPTLASLAPALSIIPDSFAIILSATPQESVDLATLAYRVPGSHFIHLFDHHSSSREIGHAITAPLPSDIAGDLTIEKALKEAGYGFFDYAGDKDAHTVVVLLNGPLALVAQAYAARVPGLGVVTVRVLRPWNESALREVLPASVKRVHVFDDVPTEASQGPLYVDVFSSLLDPAGAMPSVHAHRLVPSRTQEFVAKPDAFLDFIRCLVPGAPAAAHSFDAPATKKLLFFGTPGTPLTAVPHLIEETFASNAAVRARRVTDHDVFSRPGGIVADRIVVSSTQAAERHVPVSALLPLHPQSGGEADFVAVLDTALLKSHSVLEHAKPGTAVVVATSWTPAEFASNLPADVLALVRERRLHLYTIDAKGIAAQLIATPGDSQDALQATLVHLAFLRLYLAGAATQTLVAKLAKLTIGASGDVDLTEANAHAWAGLAEFELPDGPAVDAQTTQTQLKQFSFSAIAVETEDGETVVNGARLASWHDAAQHLLFPAAFTPTSSSPADGYAQDPTLHPEVPDRTFLITCSVNRRLTPLEYDRNVFHIEFDTSGTGLKYEIGEALGVHGWNDEQEVLDFCAWYGVDPARLITLPVPGDETRLHTRTVFQALQQQVDLFGRPGKAFYTELGAYAANQVDKYALLFIGSPEGASTFKKMSEKETVSFGDVLRRYPSARPGIEVLCQLIGDIKPRHYSIASSQVVVGDRVDLLVVSVDWMTPSGEFIRHETLSRV